MKDNTSAAARPELAVRNSATGEPWRDNIGGAWLDPSAPGVAEYLASIAGDLAAKGFDEVQLDYIRFFSDGPYDVADTNLPNTQSFRLPAIQRVLRVVSRELDDDADLPRRGRLPDQLHRPRRPGHRAAAGGDHAVRRLLLPDGLPVALWARRLRPFPVPNDHPYDVIDETLQIMNEQQAAGCRSSSGRGSRTSAIGDFPPYTADQVAGRDAAAADNGAEGLDDLERPGHLHRGRARASARGRGRRPDHVVRASCPRRLGGPVPSALPLDRCGSSSSA